MKSIFILLLTVLVLFQSKNTQGQDKRSVVDSLFRDYDRSDVPGAAVIVIKNGKVLFKKAYGAANLETKSQATSGTNYRLASMTKQFTAMAIMILAERKKLSYESHLTDLLPGFPEYAKAITIRHLLNHTSGLIEYGEVMPKDRVEPLSDQDVLELMKLQDHTYFAPGSKFRYSNTGYTLLAVIVEQISGVPFATFLRKNIFQPLGMNHTTFYAREDDSDKRRAYGYSKEGNAFVRTDWSLTTSIKGDGSVYSSLDDLYKWDQALYTSRLVSRKSIARAFAPAVAVDETTSYGFGWFVEHKRGARVVWHGGNTLGFTAAIQRFPDKKFTVIVLTNRNRAQLAEIVDKIEDLYLFNAAQ